MKIYLLVIAAVCAMLTSSCYKHGKTVYVNRADTIYIENNDTVRLQVPQYIYIHDTAYIFKTDTLYMSQDGRQVSADMQTYINGSWFYIRDRMNTAFDTDKATRVYLYISKYTLHMSWTMSKDMVVAVATKDGILNSVVYFGVDQSYSPTQYSNPYGVKYTFPTNVSYVNPLFFDAPIIGVYTSTPGYYPFN